MATTRILRAFSRGDSLELQQTGQRVGGALAELDRSARVAAAGLAVAQQSMMEYAASVGDARGAVAGLGEPSLGPERLQRMRDGIIQGRDTRPEAARGALDPVQQQDAVELLASGLDLMVEAFQQPVGELGESARRLADAGDSLTAAAAHLEQSSQLMADSATALATASAQSVEAIAAAAARSVVSSPVYTVAVQGV